MTTEIRSYRRILWNTAGWGEEAAGSHVLAPAAGDDLRVVQRGDQRHAPDDVAEERRDDEPTHHVPPGHVPGPDEGEGVDGAGDDVGELADADQPGQE